jgi:2-dehydro-3-deoxygluconokinase
MNFELRNDCKYSIVAPSSMGVRMTPLDRQPVHTSHIYMMQATSAETNALSVSAALGLKTKVLTAFVKNSPIAQFIKSELRNRGIEYEGPELSPGGPWGLRHPFNIADCGFGLRGPRVLNDRSGEVGCTLNLKDFDLNRIFNIDGARILHLSGVICALSKDVSQFCLELARTARKSGTLISFDMNYRASFWENREHELRDSFTEIAKISDIIIGSEADYQLECGIQGSGNIKQSLSNKIDSFKVMIERVKNIFPKTKVFTATLREVLDANVHLWGAIMFENGRWHLQEPRKISVLDRIGSGDAYAGGLLYGILQGWEGEKCLQFGVATGVLAATLVTDYCTPIDEEQIWSIHARDARVKR